MKRRELLVALGAAGMVPWLDARRARAQGTAPPVRRLVFFYTPNGTIGPEWRPRGSETTFTLGRILTPLAAFRTRMLVLGGVNMVLADSGFGSHHTRGIGGLLTGRPILQGTFQSAGPPTAGWASGVSIDQHVANTVGTATPFRSLELGVRVIDAEVRGRLSYRGPSQPLPPMESPYDVFDRLFAKPVAQTPGGSDRLRAERKSVLDNVVAELADVRAMVGVADRLRIDAHTEAVRDIEKRLTPAPTSSACAAPSLGTRLDVAATANMPEVGRLQMDLLATALACNLTRVATLMWTHAESDQTFPWIGVDVRHHATSHAGDGDAAAAASLTKINVWYAEQFFYLLAKLDNHREGDGTLLDHSAVVWMNEVGKGNNHAHRDLPVLIAGKCGGAFRTGRFVDLMAGGASGRPHNDLLVSLANGMGLPDKTFGDPQHCTGPLPGLS